MTIAAEPQDTLTGYFWRIRWMLEPLRGSNWPTPKAICYRRADAELWFAANWHEPFRPEFVVAEAAQIGLFCRIVLRDGEEFLEFSKVKS